MTDELKAYIADCIERAEAEQRERAEKAKAEAEEYEQLYKRACAARLAEIVNAPAALLDYCEATQRPGYKALKEGWRPDYFQINAPGLATIYFTVDKEWVNPTGEVGKAEWTGKFVVKSISTCGQHEDQYLRWYEAIAEAALLHREHEEYLRREEARELRAARAITTPAPPTTAERLESLIREIAREAVAVEES